MASATNSIPWLRRRLLPNIDAGFRPRFSSERQQTRPLRPGLCFLNRQYGVVGLEADIDGIAGAHSHAALAQAGSVPGSAPLTSADGALLWTKSVDCLGTVRGRFGFLVTPTLLVYGTGGLAYGETNTSTGCRRTLGYPDIPSPLWRFRQQRPSTTSSAGRPVAVSNGYSGPIGASRSNISIMISASELLRWCIGDSDASLSSGRA